MIKVAVFASGSGTNLQAIIDAVEGGSLSVSLSLVVSDNKDAYALQRAEKASIKTEFINPKLFKTREEYDAELVKVLKKEKINLIVLAGFMRIISPALIKQFPNKILNIHPAILPAFKGAHGIKDAFDYGVKVTGVTVHFVDEKMDHGPIILQQTVEVQEGDTADSLEERIHKVEHQLYPKAIQLFAENRLKLDGRKVKIV